MQVNATRPDGGPQCSHCSILHLPVVATSPRSGIRPPSGVAIDLAAAAIAGVRGETAAAARRFRFYVRRADGSRLPARCRFDPAHDQSRRTCGSGGV